MEVPSLRVILQVKTRTRSPSALRTSSPASSSTSSHTLSLLQGRISSELYEEPSTKRAEQTPL